MNYSPVTQESMQDLRQLITTARSRGDACLAVMLEGMILYLSLGREADLLDAMQEFQREVVLAAESTPTIADLERLYNLE